MSVKVILSVTTKADATQSFLDELKRMLPETRQFKGCLGLNVFQHQDNPAQVTLIEEWESKEDYEAYFAYRGEAGDLDIIMPMFEGEPSISYLDLVKI